MKYCNTGLLLTEFAFVFQTIATQYDNDNMPNVPANTF